MHTNFKKMLNNFIFWISTHFIKQKQIDCAVVTSGSLQVIEFPYPSTSPKLGSYLLWSERELRKSKKLSTSYTFCVLHWKAKRDKPLNFSLLVFSPFPSKHLRFLSCEMTHQMLPGMVFQMLNSLYRGYAKDSILLDTK